MKTLILIAMLSLTACASTPLNSRLVPDSDLLWELYARQGDEQQYKPQVATPIWDIFVRGMSRALRVEEARRANSPAFRCYTYGRVTSCNPY